MSELSPETRFEEGAACIGRGQIGEACEVFREALRICPELLDDVAAAWGREEDRAQAIGALRRSAESGDVQVDNWALLARLERDAGRLDDALGAAERAVAAAPTCASWWFNLGEIQLLRNNLPGARDAYRRCLAIAPNHLPARAGLRICGRRRPGLARFLAGFAWVHRLLKRLAWTGGRLAILEARGNSPAAHQMRWAQALEVGSALPLFQAPPRELESAAVRAEATQAPPVWHWFLAQGVEKNVRVVLDVGCGTSFLGEFFLRRGFEVTGVTCSPHEKRECQSRGIKVLEADFHFLGVAPESFDLVLSSHSLEHSISPLFALWEWKRVLRVGGWLLVVAPLPIEQDARVAAPRYYDPSTDTIDFGRSGEEKPSPEVVAADHSAYGMSLHYFVLDRRQLRRLFELAGFDVLAEAVEDPMTNEVTGVATGTAGPAVNPQAPRNAFFLLRKPPQPNRSEGPR